jgi:hypothetical protein
MFSIKPPTPNARSDSLSLAYGVILTPLAAFGKKKFFVAVKKEKLGYGAKWC